MSEQVEIYQAIKQAGAERRASNRQTSPEVLREHGIAFKSLNGGAHLVIEQGRNRYDFWPGTGKWWRRIKGHAKVQREARGVFNLVKDITQQRGVLL